MWRYVAWLFQQPRAWRDSSIKRLLHCADRQECHIPISRKFCFKVIIVILIYPPCPVLPSICRHWGMPSWQLSALPVLERNRPVEMGNLMYASHRLGNDSIQLQVANLLRVISLIKFIIVINSFPSLHPLFVSYTFKFQDDLARGAQLQLRGRLAMRSFERRIVPRSGLEILVPWRLKEGWVELKWSSYLES